MAEHTIDVEKGVAGPHTNEKWADTTSEPMSPGMSSVGKSGTQSWSSNRPLVGAGAHLTTPWSSFTRFMGRIGSRSRRDLRSGCSGTTQSTGGGGNTQEEEGDDDEDDDEDEDSSAPIVRKIHEMPKGYPKLAAFLDSDENFMMYRRFGYLQSRLLLERQDDLRRLEEELDRMDRLDAQLEQKAAADRLETRRWFRESFQTERMELLQKIEQQWTSYAALLTTARQMSALNKPTAVEHQSLTRWMSNVKPLYDADARFVQCKEDLVTLRPGRECAWLDAGIERLLRYCRFSPIENLFRSKEIRLKCDGKNGERLYTRARIERLVVIIITFMILVLLIVPIYLLYHFTEQTDSSSETNVVCIGVLLVFTLAFAACISLFTRAKRHEILAASAAYCAVLVVFIGNIRSPGSNGLG